MKHEIQMTINHDDIHLWSFCRNFLYLLPRQNIVNECLFVLTKTIFVQIFFYIEYLWIPILFLTFMIYFVDRIKITLRFICSLQLYGHGLVFIVVKINKLPFTVLHINKLTKFYWAKNKSLKDNSI